MTDPLTHTIVNVQQIDSVDPRPGPKDVTAVVRVDPQALQAGVDLAAGERADLLQLKADGGIRQVEVASIVAEMVRDWSRQWDALEKLRTDTTKPLNEAKRRVDALFKPGLDGLKSLRELAGELLGDWEVYKANRQREALAIATEAAQTGAMPELTSALNIANAPAQKSAGVTAKARWVARVVDVASLPLRFQKCIADEAAISAYVARFESHQVPEPVKGLAFELVGAVTQVRR